MKRLLVILLSIIIILVYMQGKAQCETSQLKKLQLDAKQIKIKIEQPPIKMRLT